MNDKITLIEIIKTGVTPKDLDYDLAKEQLSSEINRRIKTLDNKVKNPRRLDPDYKGWRNYAVKKLGNSCITCGKEIEKGQVDLAHIFPYELFPEYGMELWNVQVKHRACHKKEPNIQFQKSRDQRLKAIDTLKKLDIYENSDIQISDKIKTIRTEYEFNMRWDLVCMYHDIGEVLSQRDNVSLKSISRLTGVSERNLYRAVQFYNKFPNRDLLPEGKNTSWHKIVNKYLPKTSPLENPEFAEETCQHKPITICSKCHKHLEDTN